MAPLLRCTSFLLILLFTLHWFGYNCLAAEPTVIEGSTYVLPSGSFTGDLTDVNLSGLFDGTPTSTDNAAAAVAVTPTSSANLEPTSVAESISSAAAPTTASPVQTRSSAGKSTSESNKDGLALGPGPIAGIVVGAIAVIILAVLLCVFLARRNKNNKQFDRGRGITPSMVISMRTKTPSVLDRSVGGEPGGFQHKPVQTYYPDPSNIMMSQPSESITAAIDQMYKVKQYNTKPSASSTISTPQESSNPRLSKYSYLAHAFTQMRESYAAHPSLMSSSAPAAPSTTTTTDTAHLRSTDDEDDNNSIHQTTQHLPTSLTPPPPRIAVFNEHSEQVIQNEPEESNYNYTRGINTPNYTGATNTSATSPGNRDSMTSDVSQYSAFSNPFRYPSPDNNNSNNHTINTPRPRPAQHLASRKQYNYI
ncbi:hypothetical protein BDB00DRAFT_835099 [Zychaea mexicana]|uniref:uncharacterized protein n=1 Tax=Zychaea mexicana TaxID=64656 RepID=UPI0022FEAED8|nr:uncharacterized protein BDB00DRAFT_835099 [Zychaea mexicana]KAI9491081.1 hypothetical protein BDB00DRAFT_835099 [Zychaea mexicana]